MLKRPHYIALALVAVLTLIFLNLPAQITASLKLGLGSLFLPLFGLSESSRELVDRSVDALTPSRELARQKEKLRQENQQLRLLAQRLEAVEQENSRLRQLLEWRQQQRSELRLARVIGREPSNWWRAVLIDFGSRQGARPNLPVLTPEGLVGRINAVFPAHSQVVLLGDPSCKVAVRIDNEARDTGIIGPASPLDRDLVELSYLSRSAILLPGQNVRTSGEGGIFPRDIPVGTILDSKPAEYGLYMARVKLAVNLGALDEVWIMIPPAANSKTAAPPQPTSGAKFQGQNLER